MTETPDAEERHAWRWVIGVIAVILVVFVSYTLSQPVMGGCPPVEERGTAGFCQRPSGTP